MNKRKICCFCEHWATGGIESFLHNLLQMDLTGLEIDLVAAKLEKNGWSEALESRGIRFIQLSGSLSNLPANHRKFRQLLRQRQYDVVHLNLFQGLSLYYARIARQEGVPVRIAHSHNAALRKSATRSLKRLLHRFGRRCFTKDATALWTCSEAAADFLFHRSRRRVSFVPNGIDTHRFRFDPVVRQTLRGELGLDRCLVLGNVGRLCTQKNQVFLLDVFSELVQMRQDSRLLLVGDGDDRPMLERRAEELGIEKKVIFFGRSSKVAQLLWVMDVFALPSLFEGLPLAAVEAQAAGLPVLCARGLAEEVKVTEDLHFLPLKAGAKAWADGILDMVSRNAHREQAAEAVRRAGFEARTVAQQIMQVYVGRNDGATENFNDCSGL